jgi:glycosyltransferase involved in cell wall biosynthesis
VNLLLKKHILVISQYFYPEQFRINDICAEWIKRNYQVTVITGIPNYPEGKYFEGYGLFKKRIEVFQGINIHRLWIIPRGNNSISLILNYFSFVFSGMLWQFFTKLKADVVFIFEVSPMTQALPGVWYAKKSKIPCHLYVQDLWPENVEIITGITNKSVIALIGKMVDYIYANCKKIFVTSPSYIKAIQGRGVPEGKITYWPQYAEDVYRPFEGVGGAGYIDRETFNLIFAGNIGNAQGLDILPKVAERLKEEGYLGKIIFNLVGDGRYKEELISLVRANDVSEMFTFIPRQPERKIPELMALCDAALLCLTAGPLFEMTIPAKLQTYLACAMPIIASAGGETARIISESETGFSSPPGDECQLAENIITLYNMPLERRRELGKNARLYCKKHFDKNILLEAMDAYLAEDYVLEE